MERQKKMKQSLLSMLPNSDSLRELEKDLYPHNSLEKICQWAYEQNILLEPSRDKLEDFLNRERGNIILPEPEYTNFNTFMDDLCSGLSVNSLVSLLNEYAEAFGFPIIQPSMITRLRKQYQINTSKKRLVLRLLSFWAGRKEPSGIWNYNYLLQLQDSLDTAQHMQREKEGVVMLFHLENRGEMISPQAVEWLKDEIPKATVDLQLKRRVLQRNIEVSGVASLKLKFHKKTGREGEPQLYSEAVRDAIALWHQLNVRWLLSPYSSMKKILKVFIYAGTYQGADSILQPLIPLKLPDDPVLIMTDFARFCADLTDVRAVFSRHDLSREYDRNQFTRLWTIRYLWVWNYYDYIPALLHPDFLPKSHEGAKAFRQELYYPTSLKEKRFKALQNLDNGPSTTLLMLEIAKVLMARRMYTDADHVLGMILRMDPLNVVARVGRMKIYSCMALESNDMEYGLTAFRRAEMEGEYISQHGQHDEEVWTEHGRTYLKKAIYILREGTSPLKDPWLSLLETSLDEAIEAFTKGMTISPTGKDNRCLFYLLYSHSLKCYYQDQMKKSSHKKELLDEKGIFRHTSRRVFQLVGFSHIEAPDEVYESSSLHQIPNREDRNMMKPILMALETYLNSILSRTHLANSKFSIAALLWDFSPQITLGIYRRIMELLQEAMEEMEKLIPQKLAVYSFISEQYISPERFVTYLKSTLNRIKGLVPKEYLNRSDEDILHMDSMKKNKIFLWWFLENPERGLYLD